MELTRIMNNSLSSLPSSQNLIKLPNTYFSTKLRLLPYNFTDPKTYPESNLKIDLIQKNQISNSKSDRTIGNSVPTMSEIMEASRLQNLDIRVRTIGPFFRITAKSSGTGRELGRADGVIRVWFGGKILHLDSIKLKRETIGMEKSIFGIGLFIGAVAIRHGYDCGCRKAELLAIYDTDLYHSKLVRFYRRLGFREVYEVEGSSLGDMSHMLVWGGVGTRMDANIEDLMIRWCSRFKPKPTIYD